MLFLASECALSAVLGSGYEMTLLIANPCLLCSRARTAKDLSGEPLTRRDCVYRPTS